MFRIALAALAVSAVMASVAAVFGADPSWPRLPSSLASHGAAVADGWLYVYGGHTGKTHDYSTDTVTGRFQRLRLSGGTDWEDLPAGEPLQGMNLATFNGRIYRVGGMQPRNRPGEPPDNHSVRDAAVFDPASRRWEPLPPLPEPRSSHDLVALDGKLYVLGGWIMRGAAQKPAWPSCAYVLDLGRIDAGWQSFEQPFQRRALTAAAVRGKLYVLGGLTESGDAVQSVDVFDPAAGRWTVGPEFPGDGVGFSAAACTVGEHLILSTSDGRLHRLDSAGERWLPVGSLSVPRIVHRLVPIRGDSVMAVGGASRKGDARILESATLSVMP
jgi:N-acetylneuraminic acid mutarotase